MKRQSVVLLVLVGAFTVFAAATWFVTIQNQATKKTSSSAQITTSSLQKEEILVRPYSPVIGPENALVTIVEFFDPACEACRAFYPILKGILAEHPKDVRIVIRYAAFHGDASMEAVRVLEAARMQEKFEPVLEALLREQPRWASHGAPQPGLILEIATSAGLDMDAAKSQIMSPSIVGILNQDRSDVESIGVNQTPTFFVNGKPLDPFGAEELRALVTSEIARIGS